MAIIHARMGTVYMIVSNCAWIEPRVNISAPRIRSYIPLPFPIEGVRARYGGINPFCGASSSSFFRHVYGRYAERSYGFMAVGMDGVLFSLFIFFFFSFSSRAQARVHSKRASLRDRPSVRVFFYAKRARKRTKSALSAVV